MSERNVLDLPSNQRFRLVPAAELKPRSMDWQVSDLFESDTLLLIVGDPGSGKSFWGLDLAACVATGTPHHGRPVKPGPVVYIAGEGHNGIARRLSAWSTRRGIQLANAPLYVSEGPASIGDPVSTEAVMEAVDAIGDAPSLLVFDTLNRNLAGDENSTKDMGAFISACDEIRAAYRCTVALVHHTGHGDKSRARGSSVLHGAVDTTYHLKKDPTGIVTVTCTRMKDGPSPPQFAFRITTAELALLNQDGSEVTSATIEPCCMPNARPTASGKLQQAAIRELQKIQAEHSAGLSEDGRDPGTAKVRRDDWRRACLERQKIEPNRFAEVEKSLKKNGLLTLDGDYVALA